MGIGDLVALRGIVLCAGVTVALVAVIIVGVLLPRRFARTERARMRDHLLQGVTLLLAGSLALATVGLWMNRTYVMYPTWADLLLGSGDVGTAQTSGAATAPPPSAAAESAPVSTVQRDPLHDRALTGVQQTDAGQWVSSTIIGSASNVTSSALIYLPPGYMSHPERRYPVILAFSGIPGSPATFRDAFQLGSVLDEHAADGKMPNAIVVASAVYPGHEDTECVDRSATTGKAKHGTQWETWIAKDVVGFAKTHLRTIEDPAAWATLGYSAGGWCATMISVRHPDIARTSLSMAGYFQPDYGKGQEWNKQDDPRYDLVRIVKDDPPPVRMYLFMGQDDPLPKPTLAKMQKVLTKDSPTSLTVQSTPRGGHAVTLWISHLDATLDWLSSTTPAFGPT